MPTLPDNPSDTIDRLSREVKRLRAELAAAKAHDATIDGELEQELTEPLKADIARLTAELEAERKKCDTILATGQEALSQAGTRLETEREYSAMMRAILVELWQKHFRVRTLGCSIGPSEYFRLRHAIMKALGYTDAA